MTRASFSGRLRPGKHRFDLQDERSLLVRVDCADTDELVGNFFAAIVAYRYGDGVLPGLPVRGMTLDVDEVVNAMAFDKKVKAGKLRFVLPDRIGHVVIRDDVPIDLVRRAVEALRG